MHNMEVIYVSPLNHECGLSAKNRALEMLLSRAGDESRVEVWMCADRKGDIVILLHQAQEPGFEDLSREGVEIANYFSRFGWVSHTRWARV